ncbi:MAG TPA: GAF domain-containing protein [Chloroflexia bacterium]|nr:GAF domain-containing protein [Chloroflexia bacterium]
MNDPDQGQGPDANPEETIARQAAEIAQLREQLADEQFAQELRAALALAATVSAIAAPISHGGLLDMIVATAAEIIAARAAALFLIDEESQELVFEVALGQKAEEVKKFRVPLGHGIAGLVAVTGQPMAISDAQSDARQAADIARGVGYVPHNILCVPLVHEDQIVGVLELLDKQGAPSFSTGDMQVLGHFANLAAVAIEHSRASQHLAELMDEVLHVVTPAPGQPAPELRQRARTFAAHTEDDAPYRRALEMAWLVQQIVQQGEHETKACQTILRGFADYLRTRAALSGEPGTRR